MTNLTKEIRAAVIESVIKGTFIEQEKEIILKRTAEALRKAVMAEMPAGFTESVKNLPAEWFMRCDGVKLPCGSNPKVLLNPDKYKSDGHFRVSFVEVDFESFAAPAQFDCRYGSPSRDAKWAESNLAVQISAAIRLAAKEAELRSELGAFLASVKTYKQVIEKMPELERHLPAPPAKVFPVVTSTKPLRSALAKLGFDRSAA